MCGCEGLFQIPQRYRFSSKSQLTASCLLLLVSCFRYHKGTDFQANHNRFSFLFQIVPVVLDTTKVQIFKQITTKIRRITFRLLLFQIPQRYRFSSKSQHMLKRFEVPTGCFRYHKGTDFQANHNRDSLTKILEDVVLDTTKVQIFKQITTIGPHSILIIGCFRYHKGTDFQANHNLRNLLSSARRLFQIPQRYRFSSKSQLL